MEMSMTLLTIPISSAIVLIYLTSVRPIRTFFKGTALARGRACPKNMSEALFISINRAPREFLMQESRISMSFKSYRTKGGSIMMSKKRLLIKARWLWNLMNHTTILNIKIRAATTLS